MKNLEFAEKYGITFDPYENKISLINLYPYQKEILRDLEGYKFIAFQHSRQMGLTTMLVFHICNFLLHNTNKNNLLCFKSSKTAINRDMINKVKNILAHYPPEGTSMAYLKNNQSSIKLANGNEFRIISDLHSLKLAKKGNHVEEQDKDRPYALIVDNAAWVDKLDRLVTDFLSIDINQIILVSNKRKVTNTFQDIFTKKENVFYQKSFIWKLNPKFTDEWYSSMKKMFGDNLNDFYCEVDLIDVPQEVKTKDRIINVRLDDDTMNKLSLKLIEYDLSLSEYIRKLIKKDI